MEAQAVGEEGSLIDKDDLVVESEVAYCILIGIVLQLLDGIHLFLQRGEEFTKCLVAPRLDKHRQGVHHHCDGGLVA